MTNTNPSSTEIQKVINIISLGYKQDHLNIEVYPLIATFEPFQFLTLHTALEQGVVKITETSKNGSVPQLKVKSISEIPILLLDGEELIGSKQNRILNTSIVVQAKGTLIIPVSCTEEGRWSYSSRKFRDSDEILYHPIRSNKMNSVNYNLKYSDCNDSDQRNVWNEIRGLYIRENIFSRTRAMKNIYINKRKELENISLHFPLLYDQNGLLVCIDGKAIGFDLLSSKEIYKQYHEKLLRSYLLGSYKPIGNDKMPDSQFDIDMLKNLIDTCNEDRFRSNGDVWVYRYEGNGVIGSLLKVKKNFIHDAFFKIEQQHQHYDVSGRINRRRWYS